MIRVVYIYDGSRSHVHGRDIVTEEFHVGDHVRWNSEVGYVEGVIINKHTQDVEFHGRMRRCSEDDPQYEIRSDKTERVAMHKGQALTKT